MNVLESLVHVHQVTETAAVHTVQGRRYRRESTGHKGEGIGHRGEGTRKKKEENVS
jgi:hypothetical protein